MRNVLNSAVLMLTIALVGCSSTQSESQSPSESFDGLVSVQRSRSREVWKYPRVNLAEYDNIMFRGAGISYRPTRNKGRLSRAQHDFYIDADARARIEEIATNAFRDELVKVTGFDVVDKPGEKTLLLMISLIDVTSNLPPEQPGRSVVLLKEFGDATLVMEFSDSLTGETLIRVTERRAAGSSATVKIATDVRANSEVSRLAKRWAQKMREGIDALGEGA